MKPIILLIIGMISAGCASRWEAPTAQYGAAYTEPQPQSISSIWAAQSARNDAEQSQYELDKLQEDVQVLEAIQLDGR